MEKPRIRIAAEQSGDTARWHGPSFRIAHHLDIVLLGGAGGAAALGDEFIEPGFHFSDFFRHPGGKVVGLAGIFAQMVELDGLGWDLRLPSSRPGCGDVFPRAVAQ